MSKTQPVNQMWGRYKLNYHNKAIRTSYPKIPPKKAQLKLWGQSPTNDAKSTPTYSAPVQQVHIATLYPPHMREKNELNPQEQTEFNLAMSKIQAPLPDQHLRGKFVTYDERLQNRTIYDPKFNWMGVSGVSLILITLILFSTVALRK